MQKYFYCYYTSNNKAGAVFDQVALVIRFRVARGRRWVLMPSGAQVNDPAGLFQVTLPGCFLRSLSLYLSVVFYIGIVAMPQILWVNHNVPPTMAKYN